MAQAVLTAEQQQAIAQLRQSLIEAGGDPTYVNELGTMSLILFVHFVRAGHRVERLCPPPTPEWEYWQDRYGEY